MLAVGLVDEILLDVMEGAELELVEEFELLAEELVLVAGVSGDEVLLDVVDEDELDGAELITFAAAIACKTVGSTHEAEGVVYPLKELAKT